MKQKNSTFVFLVVPALATGKLHAPFSRWQKRFALFVSKTVLLVISAVFSCVMVLAQPCSNGKGDSATASAQLATTESSSVVFDIAARYGESVIPTLRKLSKPERPIERAEGAAQAALAKLGDQIALEQLKQELEGKRVREKRQPIRKLGFVDSPEAVSIVMSFLLNDNCRHCFDVGDTGYDPRVFAHDMLTRMLPNPPIERSTYGDQDLAIWEAWWQSNKDHIQVVQPHLRLSDPNLRCLAIQAEWNRVEAVALLAEQGGTSAIPALHDLVRLGYKDELGNFNTVRGAARTALAMLGEQSEFTVIVHELGTRDYVDALLKLRYIGTKEALDAITKNIDEIGFITSNHIVPYDYDAQVKRHRNEFLTVLSEMVRNSPVTPKDAYSSQDVEVRKAWWAQNRQQAELAVTKQ